MTLQFEWDPQKAVRNFKNHGISFEEASTVFDDPILITVLDEKHSVGEDRYMTLGLSYQNRLLLIAHTEREEQVRIISARKATLHERKFYEEGF